MWSDEMDNKIRKTTEGSHHAYNDKAWNKMEELLETHLPQSRRRRFIALLLLPLALISTGVYFAIQKQTKDNGTGESITAVQPIPGKETIKKEADVKTTTITPAFEKINNPAQPSEMEVATSTEKPNKGGLNRQPAPGQTKLNHEKVTQQRSQPT